MGGSGLWVGGSQQPVWVGLAIFATPFPSLWDGVVGEQPMDRPRDTRGTTQGTRGTTQGTRDDVVL